MKIRTEEKKRKTYLFYTDSGKLIYTWAAMQEITGTRGNYTATLCLYDRRSNTKIGSVTAVAPTIEAAEAALAADVEAVCKCAEVFNHAQDAEFAAWAAREAAAEAERARRSAIAKEAHAKRKATKKA